MSIGRQDWIRAALAHVRTGGVDAVGIASLARDLSVTKGSFYWHFANRDELLEELLQMWESETDELVSQALKPASPLARVLRFFELVAERHGQVPDLEFFAWSRRDKSVALRADAVEAKRVAFVRDQLSNAGLRPHEAKQRAEACYLSTLGWLERASRNRGGRNARDFAQFTDALLRWVFSGAEAPERSEQRRSLKQSERASLDA